MYDELDELIRRQIEVDRLPGLAIALVRGDEIVWSRGYGLADLETKQPVTPESIFAIQSVSKPVVTTAFMQWVERGGVRLDDPANDHLAPVRIQSEWEGTKPITLRHLLTHTSGLPVALTLSGQLPLEQFLIDVCKTVRPPGEEMVYANWGYDLIGYLVGRLAGSSYHAYLREHIFGRLEMWSTSIEPPPNIATGYYLSVLDGKHYAEDLVDWPDRPAGAICSTVEDLGRFLIMHLNGGLYNGGRVLREETVADMQRLHARCGPRESGMGLGFRVDEVAGRRLICHGGDGTTFTAFVAAYPHERVGVALLINMGRAQTARSVIGHAALRALLGEDGSPEDGGSPKVPDGLLGRYVSNYWGIEATLAVDGGAPVLEVEGAFVSSGLERSHLTFDEGGVARGHDGPFDGFELAFEPARGDQPARFYGGVYPFRFDWQGAARPPEPPVDETADLEGTWQGTVQSPLGPVPVALSVADGSGKITALSADEEPIERFSAERGRVSGEVGVSLPGFGDFRIFLRLFASEGRLLGRVYARGAFGEAPMPTELSRESPGS